MLILYKLVGVKMYKLLIYDDAIFTLLKNSRTSHLFKIDLVGSMQELTNRIYGESQYDLVVVGYNKILSQLSIDMFADMQAKLIVSFEGYNTEGLLTAVRIGAVDVFEKPVDIYFLKQLFLKHLSKQLKSVIPLNEGYTFSRSKCLIINENTEYHLSNKERLLLEILSTNINKVTSYEEIESYVWQGDFMSSDSLRTLIKNIRKKLPDNSIRTVKGFGYMLEVHETVEV